MKITEKKLNETISKYVKRSLNEAFGRNVKPQNKGNLYGMKTVQFVDYGGNDEPELIAGNKVCMFSEVDDYFHDMFVQDYGEDGTEMEFKEFMKDHEGEIYNFIQKHGENI